MPVRVSAWPRKSGSVGEAARKSSSRSCSMAPARIFPRCRNRSEMYSWLPVILREEHVRMQAALQRLWIIRCQRRSTSPKGHRSRLGGVYLLAWELGCKGITVYVTGSREKWYSRPRPPRRKNSRRAPAVVLAIPYCRLPPGTLLLPAWRCRNCHPTGRLARDQKAASTHTVGSTFRVETPLGKAFITVNQNGGGHPFEVFINTAKAGSETRLFQRQLAGSFRMCCGWPLPFPRVNAWQK